MADQDSTDEQPHGEGQSASSGANNGDSHVGSAQSPSAASQSDSFQSDGSATAIDERPKDAAGAASDETKANDRTTEEAYSNLSHVVGIGASAGGLDAIERLFDNMPADSGMAFVVVQHLSPDFKSLMDELLARHTSMKIHRVEDGMLVEANGIYLIPPKKNMVLSQGRLLLTDQDAASSLNLPIDIFFRSLAQDAGRKAIAVVLSGTGSDGSRGIQDVYEAGGMIMVQDLESAGFDGMPRAAASTKLASVVCRPEQMPAKLLEYTEDPSDFARGEGTMFESMPQEGDRFEIFRIFRHKFGIDFSLYKAATMDRRIERRMQMTRTPDMKQYIAKLESDPGEVEHLFRDLLVEVTQFFRDPEAFGTVQAEVAPRLVSDAAEEDEIRVWVPGCATGEEAYSLAMIFHDEIRKQKKGCSLKVFATDVHDRSLETASAGVYSSAAIANVPEDLQSRYFTVNGDLFHITRDLRQSVIFAPNDITRDPPFTKMDFISCRNVLIYLEPRVQKKVLSLFHFGLKTGGVLFLGPSETLGELDVEFEVVDRHWRIYRKQRDVRLPMTTRMPSAPAISKVVHGRAAFVARPPIGQGEDGKKLFGALEELLSKYVPPSLLVNEYFELIHSFGDARKMLIQPEGRPTLDVLKMVRGDLRIALSAALHKAGQQRSRVVYKGVRIREGDDEVTLKVVVEPYNSGNDRMFLISLEKVKPPKIEPPAEEQYNASEQSSERITVLEQELAYTRETLQSTVEELETSNEELQSTNEELIASNEELQSTNEELHSVNEELYTVNAEHKQKIEELTLLTGDMDNLLKSSEIGIIFLDLETRIRMFTPAITSAFNVIDQDVGRPIDHIAYKLDYPDLMDSIEKVLETGKSFEKEAKDGQGQTFLQRIRPYRTPSGDINGIALTVTDITAVKEVERAHLHNAQLARSNRDLQDFAYAVSHDLQAPLRHISISCMELDPMVPSDADPEFNQYISRIGTSAESLTEMIQGLLTYSRITTRGKDFNEVDCQRVVQDVIDDLHKSINSTRAKIDVGELPEIWGDDVQLQRVFHELIDNAIKYASDRPCEISVDCEKEDEDWVFSVTDNGVGIERRHLDRVFVVFQRLGFKEEVEGRGLGLTLCKRIIERHNGRIWAESVPGESTTIKFTLPATRQLADWEAEKLAIPAR